MYIRMHLQVSYHNWEDDGTNDVVKAGIMESREVVALYSLWRVLSVNSPVNRARVARLITTVQQPHHRADVRRLLSPKDR
jgi:hypothetical protein